MDTLACKVSIIFCIFLMKPLFSFAYEGNTQQIFHSNVPADIEVFSHRTFEILQQPERCSYSDLEKCHARDVEYYLYYENCFSDMCSKEEYYCLDLSNDSAIHICGEGDKCKKRRRNIVVRNDSSIVHVYSIPCPLGYFQQNSKMCFDICKKDPSILFQKINDNSVIARCKSEEGYCNPKNLTFFDIDSEDDVCVENISCAKDTELMPDCSCTKPCQIDEERDWREPPRCAPKQPRPTIFSVSNHTTEAAVGGITDQDSDSSGQSMNSPTSSQNQNRQTSYAPRHKAEESDKIHGIHPEVIVVVVFAIVALVALVVAIVAMVKWKTSASSLGGTNYKIGHHNKDNLSIKIEGKVKDFHFHNEKQKLLTQESSDNKDINRSLAHVTHAPEPETFPPLMRTLKVPDDQENDS